MTEERFEELVARYGPALRRLVASWERDPHGREDLLQEVFVALWRALPRFRGECSERTFVFRVANNRVLSHRFRQRPASEELSADFRDRHPTPEDRAAQSERFQRLLSALHRLPDASRQILTLALEDLTRSEIAEILGITENNAGVRLSRARRALLEMMETP